MNPNLKKALSVVGAAAAGAALVAAQKSLIPLAPEGTQIVLVALATSIAHWINTWGHAERVEAVATAAVAKANAQ